MRPYRILTLTLGLRERVVLTSSPAPLVEWRWWCRGPLRRRWGERAFGEALDLIKREVGEPRYPQSVSENPPPPQQYAVEVSVALGFGLPDEWRRARWRDVQHALRFSNFRQTPADKQGEPPRWGEAETPAVGIGQTDPRWQRLA